MNRIMHKQMKHDLPKNCKEILKAAGNGIRLVSDAANYFF